MLLILDSYCRARCYCWVGNLELARAFGCSESTLLSLLKEMESEGLLHRAEKNTGRKGRLGIILLKRADADLPVATQEEIPELIRMMRITRDQSRGQFRLPLAESVSEPDDFDLGKPGADPLENRGHGAPGKPGAELRVVFVKEDESQKDVPEKEPEEFHFSRQRPDPKPKAEPTREARGTSVAECQVHPATVSPPALVLIGDQPALPECSTLTRSDLTPGQHEFLRSLPSQAVAVFESLSPEKQAETLAPHLRGLDRIIAGEFARRRLASDAPPPPDVPETTVDLIARLPGGPPPWVQVLAESLARDFGGKKDRNLWSAFLAVAQAVWRGEFPADRVADAYRQATGPAARNPGAVFNYAIQVHGWKWGGCA